MGRWLAIDHGSKRIGVAAGSTADGIASPLAVISAAVPHAVLQAIRKFAADYQAEGIVVGWPLNMDDSEGPQAKAARAMAVEIQQATGMDVRLWDERLSSFAADEALAGTLTRNKRRARQDAVAAAMVLQDFLANGGPDSAPKP